MKTFLVLLSLAFASSSAFAGHGRPMIEIRYRSEIAAPTKTVALYSNGLYQMRSYDEKGALLDASRGTLDLDIAGITVWRDRVSEAFPEVAETAAQVAQVIQGLSKGGDRAVVKLNVQDGTVYLGLFPIAFIPPF